MVNKKTILLLLLLLSTYAGGCVAGTSGAIKRHPLYVGVTGGYGSTTWFGLVPSDENANEAMRTSTPIRSKEGGGVWGVFAGYELIPLFAIEAAYTHYPKATIMFDPEWYYSEDNPGLEQFTTDTETVSVIGKLMLLIPHTQIKAFASVGGAGLHQPR